MIPRNAVAGLSLGLLLGCGEETTTPVLTNPGYVLTVNILGLTDTTFQGDSLHWRLFSRPTPIGRPERRQVTLEIVVLNPPAPLASPLMLDLRWVHLQSALPAARPYPLSLDPPGEVLLQASSNLGTWRAARGSVTLTSVSDSSLHGTITATLVPMYPPSTSLPVVRIRATFSAPRVPGF